MSNPFTSIRHFLKDRFNLDDDKADELQIIESIKRDVHFKGTNLWTLIFAIFIASIGLNVDSTAVIIGAMLISPIMGPIMGIGLAIAINDFELLQRGVKNLSIAVGISILTSTLYFSITPLHDANAELLARTNPSLWDVFIAFFGGLAGIVAGTRKEKSNVIPGVAIATALMPPLCTAGFGLATGKWIYLLGAMYLFFINSLFICIGTFLIVKRLKFHKKEFTTREVEKRVSRTIWLIVILTILPSIYLAYRIVQRSIFENNAKHFVQKEFHFARTQIVSHTYKTEGNKHSIELLAVGQALKKATIDSLKKRMSLYNLDSTELIIHQGLDAKQEINLAEIKASILEDVFATEKQDTAVQQVSKMDQPLPDLSKEIKALFPTVKDYILNYSVVHQVDSTRRDTLPVFTATVTKNFLRTDQTKLSAWLKQRLKADTLRLVIDRK